MCGILGYANLEKNLRDSRQALNTLEHRGPDQWNDWHDKNVYLGHRRLSIMDVSENGKQPMAGQGVIITVNGEIYNFAPIKKQLEKKYKFHSSSDSEVLIYGYLEWGIEKLINKLEGMYAFVLYDTNKQKLFVVRDRVGIKPLYYSMIDGQLAWASELKALEALHKQQELEIDYTAVYDYLTYRYIPTPKTLYKKVFKLEPAHYLEYRVESKDLQKRQYWKLDLTERKTNLQAAAKKVRQLVDEAVEQQLMSDVPVGFFLSGGMDSSTVVACATKFTPHINTYSIGFDVKEHDETHFAQMVSKKFKTNHLRREVSVNDVKKLFDNLKVWYDEPFADTSAFPVFVVSKNAKATSTVVLTGDGGDEVFGGYNWYRQFADGIKDYIKENSPGLRSKLLNKLGAGKSNNLELEFEFYTKLMAGLTKKDKQPWREQFNIPADYDDYWYFRKYYSQELPLYTRLQYMDFHTYLPDDILTKVDRASMAVALECRVPLLSTELIEYCFSLPESIRYHDGELKGLMKYAFSKVLPAEIIYRDKKGFSIPTGRWQPYLMEKGETVPEHILNKLFPNLVNKK